MELPSFKVIVLGDAGVGKSAYINRMKTGEFTQCIAQEMTPLVFHTNHGSYKLNVWEDKIVSHDVDAAIVMFDLIRRDNIVKYKINKPLVICGNKCDLVTDKLVNHCHYISVKTGCNINSPWLDLIKQLTGKKDLIFS